MVSSAFSTSAMAAIMAVAFSASAFGQTEEYPSPLEAQVAVGVPQEKVEGPFEFRSNVFPGTVREYWVYVPAKYDSAKPPALMIVQDGPGLANNWSLPAVLDNLIHSGEIPIQLGIFVNPGSVAASNENAQPRCNRSFEDIYAGSWWRRNLSTAELNFPTA